MLSMKIYLVVKSNFEEKIGGELEKDNTSFSRIKTVWTQDLRMKGV